MSFVLERVDLSCSYSQGRWALRELIEGFASSKAQQIQPLVLGSLAHPIFCKNVIITYSRGHDPMQFDERWNVAWAPEGGGLFPDFSGELAVVLRYPASPPVLELSGSYVPPADGFGAAFDALIGWRIASASARQVLVDLRRRIEALVFAPHC